MNSSNTDKPPDHIRVIITDSMGYRREVQVSSASLDCGCGCVSIKHGVPAYCRPFDSGILHLEADGEVIEIRITQGTASLTANSLHVLCAQATEVFDDTPSLSPEANPLPIQDAAATTHTGAGV